MWLVTRRDETGNGVWAWREKHHADQEPGKSSLCFDLHSVQRRNCLVSGTLSFPLIQSLRSISPSAQLQKSWCCQNTRFPAAEVHGTLHFIEAPYISSLWSSESGTPSPSPVMSTLLSRDILLEQTAPSLCSRRFISLPTVPWWFRPFSPSALDTSRASPVHPSRNCLW